MILERMHGQTKEASTLLKKHVENVEEVDLMHISELQALVQ